LSDEHFTVDGTLIAVRLSIRKSGEHNYSNDAGPELRPAVSIRKTAPGGRSLTSVTRRTVCVRHQIGATLWAINYGRLAGQAGADCGVEDEDQAPNGWPSASGRVLPGAGDFM
jgi:hypothetical protein